MSFTFHEIRRCDRPQYQSRLAMLEQTASYPLGKDAFQLDHGADYFAFFDRLGEVKYYAVLDKEEAMQSLSPGVIAVGAAVLRQVADRSGTSPRPTWYLCDLKVHPHYRRHQLSLRLFRYAFAANFAQCDRGYAISMNPGDGSANRVVQLLRFLCPVELRDTTTLNLYSLDAIAMTGLEPLLQSHRGAISYFSLKGVKDLRLHSTGNILPLLHVQFGATAQHSADPHCYPAPLPGYTHMFCSPHADALAIALQQRGILPSATASVVSHGMDDSDWRFILTSDI